MSEKLTTKQVIAIQSLLAGSSVQDAATLAKVARQTVYKWMDDSTFQTELSRCEHEALNRLSRRLVELGELATDALKEALGEYSRINLKLRAADIVISHLLKFRELVDMEERISALEAAQNGAKK